MRHILSTLLLLALAAPSQARDGFAIVIDPVSYKKAQTEVETYARAIEQTQNRKVYIVEDRWGVPDSIRAELQRLHQQKQEPIMGCVLVGDIPVAMVRDGQHMTSAFKMQQSSPRKESSVPSDRFYDDFSLRFRYLDRDTDGDPYFYYSVTAESAQRTHPDIISGRIRPTDVGGTSRYDKLRAYLRKATEAKLHPRTVSQLFFFSGHGYISDSRVARIDEKPAFYEHFPTLQRRTNTVGYMDHTDHNPVKESLMNELVRPDLDVAVLHHHGDPEMQYFNETPRPYMVREAKQYIMKAIREHIYDSAQKGRDADSVTNVMLTRFDLPASWAKDALSDSLARIDSLEDAATDLYTADFDAYGYQPNCPVVIIDACYCGSFHQDDCIANRYIFQPGGTICVLANTVNSLQDKWADRFIGLLNQGGTIGDMARFSTYLESHVIGDPTFRFATPANTPDLDHLIPFGRTADWRKLLKSGTPEQQALAIEMLHQHRAISSAELLAIYEKSPYGIVRLQTLRNIVDLRDDNTLRLLQLAADDNYELLQRLAIRYMADSGDERLIPELMRLSIANNTSARCVFDAGQAMAAFPKDKLLEEFNRQYDSPSVQYVRKDSVKKVIEHAIIYNSMRVAKELDDKLVSDAEAEAAAKAEGEEFDPEATAQWRILAIRSTRNTMVHHYVPRLIEMARTCGDEKTQLTIIEALGWHPLSCQAGTIADAMRQMKDDASLSQAVRDEALKTLNRINAQ